MRRSNTEVLTYHIRTSLGRPQDVSEDVGRPRPLELNIKPYGDVLITSVGDVLNTSVGDVPWRYIEDNMGMSIGCLLGTSSGRNFAESYKFLVTSYYSLVTSFQSVVNNY